MDVRTFSQRGAQYEMYGIGARAEAIRRASATARALVASRRQAGADALTSWWGPHAETFTRHLGVVLGHSVALQLALSARARQLDAFPASADGSAGQARAIDAAHAAAAAPRPALGPNGGAGAEPLQLRVYADHSGGVSGVVGALAAEVNLAGVSGTVIRSRPLTLDERAARETAGVPPEVAAVEVVPDPRPLAPDEIATLVDLRPVDSYVAPLLAAASQLAVFASTVAAAFEAADAGLLDLLAAVDPGGASPGTAAVDAVTTRLSDLVASPSEMAAGARLLSILATSMPETTLAVLSPDELDAMVVALNRAAPDASNADDVQAAVTSLSAAASASLRAADDATVDRYLADLAPHTLAVLVSSSAFDARFAAGAFERLWLPQWYDVQALGGLYSDDFAVAALRALEPHPDLAAARILGDPALLDALLTGDQADGGAAAAVVLANAFHHRVLEDLARNASDLLSLQDSESFLIRVIDRRDDLAPGVRPALAEIATLHFDPLGFVAERGHKGGVWDPVSRDDLVAFYAGVLQDPGAQDTTARALGNYLTLLLGEAGMYPTAQEREWAMKAAAYEVGQLAAVFEEAVASGDTEARASHGMWRTMGEIAVNTGGRAGLAWAGITGVPGALGVGVVALAVSSGFGRASSPPAARLPGVQVEHRRVLEVAAVQALAAQNALVANTPPLPAEFYDKEFLAAVVAGDQAAVDTFSELLELDPRVQGLLVELLDPARS